MYFKVTSALREYYRYSGVSAELERLGYGSSRPEFAWANRQKQHEIERPLENQNKGANRPGTVNECYPDGTPTLEPNAASVEPYPEIMLDSYIS